MTKNVSYSELTTGEINGALILEVTSIPEQQVLGNLSLEEIERKSKNDFSTLLSEIYQLYKTNIISGKQYDVAIELLWITEEVKNQPYNAKIRLFLVLRYIDGNKEEVASELVSAGKLCMDSLTGMKFGVKNIGCDDFMLSYQSVRSEKIRTIVKGETLNNLQNNLFPVCYSYDIIPDSNLDFSNVVNNMITYPGCAISFQLIPTHFSADEIQTIGSTSNLLNSLEKGIGIDPSNIISDSLAETYASRYNYYERNKGNSLFNYNIAVYGPNEAVNSIASKVYGHINADIQNNTDLKYIDLNANEVNRIDNFYPLPWALNERLISKNRSHTIWDSGYVNQSSYRLPYIITVEEAVNFFRLPIGNDNIGAGLPVNDSQKTSKSYSEGIINAGDITIGKLTSTENSEVGISINDLTKHMLVVGTPGCGKTTFSVGLLDRLWKEHNIPFLVIEPAKNEYRAMLQSIPELQVFTPGKNFISPFVFNPFLPPKNVKLETYKSTLKTAFSAAVSMATPLDKIFEEAISNCYSDFRWLDTYTSDDEGRVFNISDFIKCFQKTFDDIGYTGDAKNIGRAGTVRLNGLINLFDNYASIPIEDILTKPTVIELTAIENSDEKALIISLLLLSILVYINANYIGKGTLKNVILLEEAHVLFDVGVSSTNGEANPSDIAQRLIKRMLAEARAYGVGLVIADQSPRKVTTDVVALTDIKVGFRLVESEDKSIFANSTGMDDFQEKKLARLKPGEAFLFFNKLEEPEEIKTEDYREKNNIDITINDDEVKASSSYWNDKQEELRPYPECKCIEYCKYSCDYYRRILARDIARRIYVKNFKPESTSFDEVKKVFAKISELVKNELNSEPFSRELLLCVKAHLWRRIKYNTQIQISDKLIENSLKKK